MHTHTHTHSILPSPPPTNFSVNDPVKQRERAALQLKREMAEAEAVVKKKEEAERVRQQVSYVHISVHTHFFNCMYVIYFLFPIKHRKIHQTLTIEHIDSTSLRVYYRWRQRLRLVRPPSDSRRRRVCIQRRRQRLAARFTCFQSAITPVSDSC